MVENHPDTDSAGESGMRELRYETDPIDKTETPVDGYVSALTNDAWSLTSEGDAERVLGMFADRIMVLKYRYRHARIKFDVLSLRKDGRWDRSAVAVEGMILEASRHWSMRAADDLPAREAKAAIKYLTRNAESPHARKVMARIPVISQRWRETGVADYHRLTYASIDDLDVNGRYLGCANGILDLMTGRLLPLEEAKRALVTRYVGIDYRPEARFC